MNISRISADWTRSRWQEKCLEKGNVAKTRGTEKDECIHKRGMLWELVHCWWKNRCKNFSLLCIDRLIGCYTASVSSPTIFLRHRSYWCDYVIQVHTLIKLGISNQMFLFGIRSVPVAWYFTLIKIAPPMKYAAIAPMKLQSNELINMLALTQGVPHVQLNMTACLQNGCIQRVQLEYSFITA